jgi:hypothetical protein
MHISFYSTPNINTQKWAFITSFSISSMYPLRCYGSYDAELNPTGNPIGGALVKMKLRPRGIII